MWLYAYGRAIVWPFYHLLFRMRVEGLENVPPAGKLIFCVNHFKWHDPLVVGITAPRRVAFMAKEELFRNRFVAWVISGLGVFPVKRGQPDRAALRHSIDILESGGCLGIFPEGTRNRSGRLAKAEPGAAYFALKTGTPVIPVGISSSFKLFSPLIVRFGKPLDLEQFRSGRMSSDQMQGAGEAIMGAIGALLVPPVIPGSDHEETLV